MSPSLLQCSLVCVFITSIFVARVAGNDSPQRKAGNASIDLTTYQVLLNPFPYYFPNENDPASLFPMEKCNGITLEEATIDQLQDYMNHGKLTASQLAICYLQRQYQTDSYVKFVQLSI